MRVPAPGDILVVEGGGCAVPSVIAVDPVSGATIVSGGLMTDTQAAVVVHLTAAQALPTAANIVP